MTSHYTRGVHALHDFRGVLGMAFGHFSFGLSRFHGHGSWLVCEVALRPIYFMMSKKPEDHGTPNAHNRWFI
jgi:hypothetical protein